MLANAKPDSPRWRFSPRDSEVSSALKLFWEVHHEITPYFCTSLDGGLFECAL